MLVRHKQKHYKGYTDKLNTSALGEIIVFFKGEKGHSDSCFINDYEVFLEQKQEWKDMKKAFKDIDVQLYYTQPSNRGARVI